MNFKEMWKKYAAIRDIVIIVSAMVILRSSVVNWYVIPSGSMLPTIKLNDHVFVNKLSYGLMLPFTEKQLLSWNKPKRGDIILFKSVTEDVTLVKRAIGLSGDRISFERGTLKINGEKVQEQEQTDRSILADMGEPADLRTLYMESTRDLPEHTMLRTTYGGFTNMEVRDWTIPEGKIFVMGDNRDSSNDSRFWGYVDEEKVYGRSLFILYSTIPDSGLLPKFRTDRFFKTMH